MTRFSWFLAALSLALTTQPLLAQDKGKDMPGMPGMKGETKPGQVSLSGLADFYYQYSFNHPPAGSNLFGRAWDVKQDSFSLGMLELSVMRCADDKVPVMLTGVFNIGKTADLVHATEPGGTETYKYIQQLYATYETKGRIPVTIEFGKFQAWACYDQIEPTSTDNYSRGLLYTMGEPFYQMGIRLNARLSPDWTAGFYVVNGWNNVEDDNGGKTLGASIMYMPVKPVSFMLSWIGGDEGGESKNSMGMYGGIGFMMPGVLNVQMVNFNASWRPSDKLKLALNTDYASASKIGIMGGHWSGQGVVARYQFSPVWAFAVRGEHFEDTDGLKSGAAQNLNSLTATVEHKWRENLITRLEFRHDHAGTMFYPAGGGGMSQDQDTVTLAHIVKF